MAKMIEALRFSLINAYSRENKANGCRSNTGTDDVNRCVHYDRRYHDEILVNRIQIREKDVIVEIKYGGTIKQKYVRRVKVRKPLKIMDLRGHYCSERLNSLYFSGILIEKQTRQLEACLPLKIREWEAIMVVITITGASGTMGAASVECLMQDPDIRLRILLRRTKRGKKAFHRFKKRYGDRVEFFFGDIRNYEDCFKLCEGADYLLHLAAVIPPKADHEEKTTLETNCDGTANLIRAVIETGNHAKFIHISTVAIYGNRNEKHPWGRVGDPLVTSAFDVYGLSKTIAEYAVLESELNCWAVLRQTGILYDNILMNNISDGLMFHTPWNALIEWVTARDSGILLKNIIQSDRRGETEGFWKRVYNIGGGAPARQTGYETFDDGFRLIGGSAKDFFEPHWNLPRNFHCFWFSDSDELEERFHFRTLGCEDFWKWYGRRHWIYRAGGLLPAKILRKLIIDPLHQNTNAPSYWFAHNDAARIQAYFGGQDAYEALPHRWEDVDLFCESDTYDTCRNEQIHEKLDHGYDENKEDGELSLEDMKKAAAFRGGACLSTEMQTGDLYSKLRWRCHEGHEFTATPYTVLKAGHWCPVCCQTPHEWNMDLVAKYSPFHAQIWQDSHDAEECFRYFTKDGKAWMVEHL